MSITTEAIYEEGMLKLSQPIPLDEGTHVEVIIVATLSSKNHTKEILDKIAALPLEGKDDSIVKHEPDQALSSLDWETLLEQLGRSPSLKAALPLSDAAISRESIYCDREDQQR